MRKDKSEYGYSHPHPHIFIATPGSRAPRALLPMFAHLGGHMRVEYDGGGGGLERFDSANVLILGGWSSDHLDVLKKRFRHECCFYEPTLFMPPVDCASLFMWESWILAIVVVLIISLFSPESWPSQLLNGMLQLRMPLAMALALTLPRIIVLVARGAISRCVDIAATAIDRHSIDVVVGYSWGGGVGCFLLAEGRWRGATLLLAPTLDAMASAARLPTPTPFFVVPNHGRPVELGMAPANEHGSDDEEEKESAAAAGSKDVYIFHADDDGFCPEGQRSALQLTGAECHTLHDTHDLMASHSQEAIERAFADLIRRVRPDWAEVRGAG